ncbi:microtubule-associated protein 10 [Pempheris klunzingeri]|uniref:microtubule-associated protein 10 n=1 Tax=Pempheris klunzingeri TaxID=3127111 RepID=UPI0039808202
MSGRQHFETLFSFELLVEYIRIEKARKVSDELALGVRLLDFPTLLIYQPQQRRGVVNQQQHYGESQQGEYAFNRGKSCLFKMNLESLHAHLANTPLYAMVLDVKEEIPKLVGTSLISLAEVIDGIRKDVTERGPSTPSSHGERGLVGVCNLMGEKIGSASVSYKLLSLGASLLPHITERRGLERTSVHGEMSRNVQHSKPSNEDKQDSHACVAMQAEHEPSSQTPQTLKEAENSYEEESTIFCPPHLFYSNSAEERSKNTGGVRTLLNLDSEAFTSEDAYSDEEMPENITERLSSPIMDRRVRHEVKTPGNQETNRVTPNVLGEAVQRLPLLNALLVELSQLNSQSPHQPMSIHPNLAWIYRPASTEPSGGLGNTARKAQTKSLEKTRQGTSPFLKHLHPPRNCSTPVVGPASVNVKHKQEEALIESKSSTKSRKKLQYGTTKTFNLRLKHISSRQVKRHECKELIQDETQSSKAKGKTKSSNKIMKSSNRKLNQGSSLNENIETMIQSITVDSALQETIAQKGKVPGKQDGGSLRVLSESGLKYFHFSSADSDSIAQSKDKNQHHSESNQSQSESDRHRERSVYSGSSSHSTPKSSFSDGSGEANEEADYADDFNSLEPSEAYSPDPESSPEPSRAKTPKSPAHQCISDSGSDLFQRRAALPVPAKAPSSPQRCLRGTHIIRPRTHASALSFSSSDGDRDRSASFQMVCSRNRMTESSRVERSSGAVSFISSRGQRSESTKNSGSGRGFSADSVSSFEPQEAEELEDELGSLDFRKEYQHISELVANKLPGYTM